MTSPPAVIARDLTRRFVSGSGQTVTALNHLNLSISRGLLVVVRGPSGCGKSSLLNLIGLLDRPSSGELTVAGVDLHALAGAKAARFRREHIGFLFQDAGLIEPMTVADNIALPLVYRETPSRARNGLIAEVLQRVGLSNRARSAVSELSGGERQRVGLARALVASPDLLLCDEPTAALDETNSHAIVDLLAAQAAQGRTVICSSHDPVLIQRADQIIALRHGSLDQAAPA